MIFAIDVSSYQTARIDWPTVAKSNAFAIIKVSEGDRVLDPDRMIDLSGATGAGMLTGIYHFAHAELGDGATQAQLLFDNCGGTMPDLPPMLDLESRGSASPSDVIQFARYFKERCLDTFGKAPLFYTGPGFWLAMGAVATSAADLADCPLVVAEYAHGSIWTPAVTDHPTIMKPWSAWTMWQFSGGATVVGVPDACDRDCFNGNTDDLRALCGFPPPSAA